MSPILLLTALALSLARILPIILGHLLNNLPGLFDIALIMGFTTVRLDGTGPSSRGFDSVFGAGAEVWGYQDQIWPRCGTERLPSPSVAGILFACT